MSEKTKYQQYLDIMAKKNAQKAETSQNNQTFGNASIL